MPEGPEVRRYADLLAHALDGKEVLKFEAGTRKALSWLEAHSAGLEGHWIESVRSRGKFVIGRFSGEIYFAAHQMMWGRWLVMPADPPTAHDKRERARIEVADAVALLYSAPVFDIGEGDPMKTHVRLRAQGPDILPYPDEPPFDGDEFLRRVDFPENRGRAIAAALLDQTIAGGIGNYLRAEILFDCRMDPWKIIGSLTGEERARLVKSIPHIAGLAYENRGSVISLSDQERIRQDDSLVYRPGGAGNKYHVYRRTNLPCLVCGDTIRQHSQETRAEGDGGPTRRIYFCPTCQGVSTELTPKPERKRTKGAMSKMKASE